MPVTIKPASHGANAIQSRGAACSVTELLDQACPKLPPQIHPSRVIQTSFTDLTPSAHIYGSHNGFVVAATTAYNRHHHLSLRPDDIWIAILSQFSIYVNANAEKLRDHFVSHKGQKNLRIEVDKDQIGTGKGKSTWHDVDFGKFSWKMTKLIEENIKDKGLREWILPNFTTTTKTDQAVSSILMMATMQKYFKYYDCSTCGIPSVTLEGTKEDWMKIEQKAERLTTFGKQTKTWYSLLKPVLRRFVTSFEKPDSEETKEFWSKISHMYGGSGPDQLCGWITAFCFWDQDGKVLYRELPSYYPAFLKLDSASYHIIDYDDVPSAWATVPVILEDDGKTTEAVMAAGLMGMEYSSSGKDLHNKPGEKDLDSVAPQSGWCMWEKAAK